MTINNISITFFLFYFFHIYLKIHYQNDHNNPLSTNLFSYFNEILAVSNRPFCFPQTQETVLGFGPNSHHLRS
jgi:hypothetical protein